MTLRFEELDWAQTPIGEISLRRRFEPVAKTEVYEVKLGDEFLMSSLFTVAEQELARLALTRLTGDNLSIVVGGLGLGHTAHEALKDSRTADLTVIELLDRVIEWHQKGLVPVGPALMGDARCRLVQGDFFVMVARDGFDAAHPGRRYDAIILDIDHTPDHHLDPANAEFYMAEGARHMARFLKPGGVYAMWSDAPPDPRYLAVLEGAFVDVDTEVITFPNPLRDEDATATVYLATAPA